MATIPVHCKFCKTVSLAASAPTLLFLPGTLCDARAWEKPCHALRGDWPRVFVDYRFEESISAMAAKALASVDGAVIPIGLSMGGIVALEIWRQAAGRVTALAVFDTDPGADTFERRSKRDAQIRSATEGDFCAMVESQLIPGYFSTTQPSGAWLYDTVIAMALDQGAAALAAQSSALTARRDAWSLLKGINVPTLVACGADDRICPPETHERMAALLRFPTFAVIPNAGHLAPMEQPDATTRALQHWLDDVSIGARQPAGGLQHSPFK